MTLSRSGPPCGRIMTRPDPGQPFDKHGPAAVREEYSTLHGQLGPGLAWAGLGFLALQAIKNSVLLGMIQKMNPLCSIPYKEFRSSTLLVFSFDVLASKRIGKALDFD